MATHTPHITTFKKNEVDDVKRLFHEYPVVGIVNLASLPAKQLQRLKKKLRATMVLKHTRKRFMQIALDQITNKPHVLELKEKLQGVPALIFTKEDPFILFKTLKKNQINVPAKPGQLAPDDLSIQAGPTPFTPGPMIGEFGQLGLKTEIKEGKIHIKEDKVLVKQGESVSPKIAELLAKLGITPMKIGLNLTHTYFNGEILSKDVLDVDEERYIMNIMTAHRDAIALALHCAYLVPETITLLVQKAAREIRTVAKAGKILTSETVGEILAEAEQSAQTIEAQLPPLPPEGTAAT